ncbi:type 4 prepilin peptidase 1 [Hephaestia caeni]|uniref:Prepilin leader peptidase/N-methyltransferase n=1 Tax=Hephaestia caeni TaxID=645617 RepID=A0A397P933_9SPHN|nr:A24 family peptidase [Hephaestia caeni]RIA45572.1 type 4 prepilin peptidase 1 [Hephaestia caeni]
MIETATIIAPMGALLGALVGSFLATVLVRWPAGESALTGRSRCDGCRRPLTPAELVPVLSFALNRGRCRCCATPIDRTHLHVEIAAAAIAGAAFALASPPAAFGWSVLGWGLLLLALLDWRHFWLPDTLTLGLALLGLVIGGVIGAGSAADRLIGLMAGYGVLWAIARAYTAVRHRDGMGGGDPKLLGAIGAWLGWQALPFILLLASALGLILVLVALVRHRSVVATTELPFGTLLCIAALPGWLVAQSLGIG